MTFSSLPSIDSRLVATEEGMEVAMVGAMVEVEEEEEEGLKEEVGS